MTREEIEEAKNELSKLIFELGFEDNVDDKIYALNMAIQALSQEPCEKPTTEDAIKTIQELMIACTPDSKYYKVGKMAISALLENEELSKDLDEALKEIDEYEQGFEQEPCTDAVSREAVIEWLKDKDIIKLKSQEENARKELRSLPSVNPQPCDDAISREWLMRKATERFYTTNYFNHISAMIEEAPSVTHKSGKWTLMYEPKNMAVCSECGKCAYMYRNKTSAFCPNCGAKMESEDKE